MIKIDEELLKLSNKALKHQEIPVSAIITYKNRIIAKAINKKNKTNNPLDHAEIICIKKAAKKLKNWRLNECNLYVTLYPCDMCSALIKECRIKEIYYILENPKISSDKNIYSVLKCSKSVKDKLSRNLAEVFKNKR